MLSNNNTVFLILFVKHNNVSILTPTVSSNHNPYLLVPRTVEFSQLINPKSSVAFGPNLSTITKYSISTIVSFISSLQSSINTTLFCALTSANPTVLKIKRCSMLSSQSIHNTYLFNVKLRLLMTNVFTVTFLLSEPK